MSIFSVGGSTPAASDAVESKSVRIPHSGSSYFSKAFATAGNRKTWTVSFWTKLTDMGNSRQLFGTSTNANIGNPWPGFIVSVDPTSTSGLSVEEYNGSSYNAIKQTANLLRDPSAWYHIVIRYDTTEATAANRQRVYINGTEATYNGTNTNPSQNYESYWNGQYTYRIGKGGSSNGDFDGYIAEFYNIDGQSLDPSSFAETDSSTNQWKPRTAEDIKAEVTFGVNGFYLPFSNDVLATSFTDGSSSSHTVTANGDAKNERIKNNPVGFSVDTTGGQHIAGPKFGTGCASFTKSASGANYLSVADSNDWTLGSTFTLEGWFNFDDVANNDLTLMNHWKGNAALTAWSWQIDSGNTVKFFYSTNGTSSAGNSAWTWTPQNHRWYHLAIVRNSADLMFFVDGTQVGSTYNIGSSTIANIAWPLELGYYSNIGVYKFKGYMDEILISDNARYTSAFTPSTSAFSNDGNTKLLMHCDGTHGSTSFTDSSSTGHTITQNGDVIILAPKIGTGVNRTNGGDNGIYIPAANCPWAEFGTGDFTVEAWVSLDDITTNNQQFFTHRNSVNSGDWVFWWDSSTGLNWSGSSNTLAQGGTTGWASNTWVHIAASRASGVNKLFVNGTVVATNSSATQDYSATASLFIASYSTGTGAHNSSGGNIAGFMDEVRITPGKALYTSNFTPSTTAYTDDIDTRLLMHFDGGGPGTAGSDTNIGQGQYYHDSSTNAIFYEDNLPKYKSYAGFDGSGDYLSLPASTDFDFGTGAFAIEFWFWVNDSNAHTALVHSDNYYVGGNNGNWAFDCYQENVRFNVYNGTGAVGSVDSTGDKIESGVWNHVAFCRDGSGNSRIFINGALSSSVSTALNGADIEDGKNGIEIAGNISYAGPGDLNGGMDNIRISNNARYTSAFTKPTDRLTVDSNTVLLVNSDFTDGGLGADHSGNYNYFTPNNLGVEDMVEDSPTNNFATLNPLIKTTTDPTMSEGNLKVATASSGGCARLGTIVPSSGKWYAEFLVNSGSNCTFGVQDPDANLENSSSQLPISSGSYSYYQDNGILYTNGTTQAQTGGATYTTGDIIGISLNLDSNEAKWYKNNTLVYTQALTSGQDLTFAGSDFSNSTSSTFTANFGQDSSFAGVKTAQGNTDGNSKGDFYYAPPGGFLALCTDNLPTPSITDGTAHFNTKLYTGTGSELAVTGVGFQPDFTWIKTRGLTYNHRVFDVIRGTTKELYTNGTNTEVTDAQSLKTFDSDGYTLGTSSGVNPSSNSSMVSWNWKAGGTASSNTDGSITSSVSANTTAGFSIVSWTGNGTNGATVGHGLSQTPELIITKNRDDVYNWQTVSTELTSKEYLMYLNTTDAEFTTSAFVGYTWNDSVITFPSTGYYGTFNVNGDKYIGYCFHSVDGYSKIGKYDANASSDGPFIYTGFRPAFMMIKPTTRSDNWAMSDIVRSPYNGSTNQLRANANEADFANSASMIDFLSNGFKIRTNDPGLNNSTSDDYLYIAFAESPFKTANAR